MNNNHDNSLKNQRILVTRPEKQAADFMAQLESAGASPLLLPTIKIVPPPDTEAVDKAVKNLSRYQWLILSSSNGVNCFVDFLEEKGLDQSSLAHLKTICVGPKTALAAKKRGFKGCLVAKEFAAEGIIELFSSSDIKEQNILLPRALKARETLPENLRAKGATVDIVPVYETIFPPESITRLAHLLKNRLIDIITITSASAAANLVQHCPPENIDQLRTIPTACIGPISAETAVKHGLNVKVTAREYTCEGLLEALRRYLNNP